MSDSEAGFPLASLTVKYCPVMVDVTVTVPLPDSTMEKAPVASVVASPAVEVTRMSGSGSTASVPHSMASTPATTAPSTLPAMLKWRLLSMWRMSPVSASATNVHFPGPVAACAVYVTAIRGATT